METKFTKDTWGVNSANKQEVNSDSGTAIADCSKSIMITNEEKEANAKLIAAAPDLYNACVAMTGYCNKNNIEMLCPEYEMMCKALKKATE